MIFTKCSKILKSNGNYYHTRDRVMDCSLQISFSECEGARSSRVVCLSMKRPFRVVMLFSSLSMVILLPPPEVRAAVSSVTSASSLSQHTHSVSALAFTLNCVEN